MAAFIRAVRRVIEAALGMAAVVYGLRLVLSSDGVSPAARLVILVLVGALFYLGALLWREPEVFSEARALLHSRVRR